MALRHGRLARLAVLLVLAVVASGCVTVFRVDLGPGGQVADGPTTAWDLSDDGRFAVFVSAATNLGADPLGHQQVWRRDLATGAVVLVSRAHGCDPAPCTGGNGDSDAPAISANGRFVVYETEATDLTAVPDGNPFVDIVWVDLHTGTVVRLTDTDDNSREPSISHDGNRVAFLSAGTDLVAGDTNVSQDVFVHDVAAQSTQRISLTSAGDQLITSSFQPLISGDGAVVVFFYPFGAINGADVVGTLGVHDDGNTTFHEVEPLERLNDIDATGQRIAVSVVERDCIPVPPVGCLPDDESWADVYDRTAGLLLGPSGATTVRGEVFLLSRISSDGQRGLVAGPQQELFVADLGSGSGPEPVVDNNGDPVEAEELALTGDGAAMVVGRPSAAAIEHVIRLVRPPQVTSVSPAVPLQPGTITTVDLVGEGFVDGFVLTGHHVLFTNVVVIDDTTATATVSVASGASAGSVTVLTSNSRSGAASLHGCGDCITISIP